MEAAGHESTTRPRIVTVGTTLEPGERSWDQLVATLGGPVAAAGRPRDPGGAPLHEWHLRATARRDAVAPRPAGQHRAGGRGDAADDHRPRRGARRAAAVPRLRAQRRARPGAATTGPARARRRVRPRGVAGPHRGRGDLGRCRWRRPSSPTGCSCPASRTGSVRCGWCSAGPPRSTRRSPTPSPNERGSRSTRGTASPRRRRSSPPRCAARTRRRGRWVQPCPGSRSGWSTSRQGAARRGRRRDPDPRRQPVLRLLARRRRRPRRRRLVADRGRRLPRPDRRPLPGRPGQGAGHRLRLQRLPQRGRGRHRRAPGRRRGGGDRGRGRGDRRGGRGLRQADHGGRQRQPAQRRARALPGPAGPVQAALGDPRGRRRCPTRPRARSRRAGCGRPSAAERWACSSELPGSPSTRSPGATCARTPRR